ncbi:MAG: hypothetical protein ACTSV1_08240, partial [Alphaproteobacteria bacterium]
PEQELKQESAPEVSAPGPAREPDEIIPEPEPEAKNGTSDLTLWMGIFAMGLMLFGVMGFAFFIKGTGSSSDDDDDEYEDDEEEDENEA